MIASAIKNDKASAQYAYNQWKIPSPPPVSRKAQKLFNFIAENAHITIEKSGGMGMSISVAPDMLKIEEIAKREGVKNIYNWKNYFQYYINENNKKIQEMQDAN